MKLNKDEQIGVWEPELRIQRPTEDKNNPFYTRDELVQIEYGIYAPKNWVLKWMEEYDMKKELKLCWKVYCYETCYSGRPKLLEQNIFELNWPMNGRLYELRNYTDKEKFAKKLDDEIRYELWSRCEYEIYITDMFEDSKQYKKDVYQQVKMNWEPFVDYCWENRKLFGCKRFKDANKRLKELRKYYAGH